MKLRRFNPGSIRVGQARGGGSRFPGGGGGKLGCGGIAIVLIASLLFGVDPMQMLGGMQGAGPAPAVQQGPVARQSTEELCTANEYALETCNALASLNESWASIFREEGVAHEQPLLQFVNTSTIRTGGCGTTGAGVGPFYCPADMGIYIDTRFYDTLESQLGARGDFARYYVMAHEYGHHIQNLTGLADQVRSAQQASPGEANALQVAMELQADCYAGVWAARNRNLIEPGDLQEGLTAAAAIGDDTLQRNAGRRVSPESFTHGSSAQRMEWLRRGLETGDPNACDTFAQYR